MRKIKAILGLSINPEVSARYNRLSDKEKEELLEMKCQLGGTSFNVASAMVKMGMKNIELLTLTGYNDDYFTHSLRFALKQLPKGINCTDFPILEECHMGYIPDDGVKNTSQVFGHKGKILPDKLSDCITEIKKMKQEGVWRIATGVRPDEVPLIEALFEEHMGFRYLNPRTELIENESFFRLLKKTDILVVNEKEYDACVNYYEDINSVDDIILKGPSLVIVTKDEHGGQFLLSNKVAGTVRGKFKAYKEYLQEGGKIFQTGSGDWFGGSLISRFKTSVIELTEENIWTAIYFASRVAGKKVTMQGAGNGPRECDL